MLISLIKKKVNALFLYYLLFALFFLWMVFRNKLDLEVGFFFVGFMVVGLFALNSLLSPPVIQVVIKQTVLPSKSRINYFLFVLLFVLLLGFLFLFINTGLLVSANKSLVYAWGYKESLLISVCKIDYNSYLLLDRNNVWSDLNILPSPVFVDFND